MISVYGFNLKCYHDIASLIEYWKRHILLRKYFILRFEYLEKCWVLCHGIKQTNCVDVPVFNYGFLDVELIFILLSKHLIRKHKEATNRAINHQLNILKNWHQNLCNIFGLLNLFNHILKLLHPFVIKILNQLSFRLLLETTLTKFCINMFGL